jgi:hypothetical protein
MSKAAPAFAGLLAAGLAAWATSAAAYPIAAPFPGTGTLETLTETGAITQQQGVDPFFNPDGLSPPPGLSVGTPFTLTVTYDSNEVYSPNTQIPDAALHGWTAVPLGNGDSFNSLTLSAGPYTWNISDMLCFDPSNQPTCGQQFAYGPTLLFKDGHFAGLDGFLGATTQPVFAIDAALDELGTGFARQTDGPWHDFNAQANPVIPTRADNIGFGFSSGFYDITVVGHFNINPYFTSAPEPAAWMMMLVGIGGLGVLLRRRQAVTAQ